jgi:phage-related protein
MTTFELIFGNYEEAKQLWTDLANALYDMFAESGNARNEMLQEWHDLGGRDSLINSFWNVFNALTDAIDTVKGAFREVFPAVTAEQLVSFTKKVENLTEKFKMNSAMSATLNDIFVNLFQTVRNLGGVFKNALDTVIELIKPIGDAFVSIFTPTNYGITFFISSISQLSNTLSTSTNHLKILTANFKLNEKTTANLQSTFKGLFAVMDIIGQAISAIVGCLKPLLGLLPSVGNRVLGVTDSVLGVTGSFGEWIAKMDETIRKNDTFKKAIEKVVIFIQGIPEKINAVFQGITGISLGDAFDSLKEKAAELLDKLKEVFNGFGTIDMGNFDSFVENVRNKFNPFASFLDGIKKFVTGVWSVLKKAAPALANIASAIGNAMGEIGDALTKAFADADFSDTTDIINGGVLVSLVLGINKFIGSLNSTSKEANGVFSNLNQVLGNASGVLNNVSGVLNSVKDSLKAWQEELKAKTLLKIAGAIAILTASVTVLSMIDTSRLITALQAMTTEFVALFASMSVFSDMTSGKNFRNMEKMAVVMISISAAVLILSLAMKKLSGLDWNGIAKGIVGVGSLSAILVASAKSLSKSSGKLITGSAGLIVFALAITILAKSVQKLGSLDTAALAKGLVGVGALCAELALTLKTTDFDNIGIRKGIGLIALSTAINVLASAVSKFAKLDADAMIRGLTGVGVVIVELAAFTETIGNAQNVTSTAIGMTILGAAMLIFAKAVESFGSLTNDQLASGLTAMGIALAEIAVALNVMPEDTMTIGVGLVLVGAALKIIASALIDISSLSVEDLAKSLTTMVIALAAVAIATNAMNDAVAGAGALLITSAALVIFANALTILGKMSLADVGTTLLALAGAFTVIGLAGLIIEPVISGILALAAAVTLLGVGVLACGAGLLFFSAGLAALAASGAAGLKILIAFIPEAAVKIGAGLATISVEFAKVITIIVAELVEGIVAFIVAIGEATPQIVTAVVQIVTAVLAALTEILPQLTALIVTVIDSLLSTLADHMPSIVESGWQIILSLLNGIKEHIGEVVTTFDDIIIEILNAIGEKLPDVVQAGVDLIVSFIDSLSQGIEDNSERVHEAFTNLFQSLLNAALEFWGIHSPSTVFSDIGTNLIEGLIQGIERMISKVKSKVTEVANTAITAIRNKADEFVTIGGTLMLKLKTGISNKISDVKTATVKIVTNALSGIRDKISDFTSVGKDLVAGLKSGIESAASSVSTAASNVASSALSSAKSILGINSPSREFAEIGRYTDEGFANGLLGYASKVTDASTNVGKSAINSMSDILSKLSDTLEFDMDSTPTIRPVLDLTNVKSGAKQINTLFSRTQAMKADVEMQQDSISENQNGNSGATTATYQFTQNNYSPKALSRSEIYRQTKRQFSAMKGLVNT